MPDNPAKSLENPSNEASPNADSKPELAPLTESTFTEHNPSKIPWKKYFWEFFMLFLAVFCGFLAQWQLENILDRGRESEYIYLLINELESDNKKINGVFNDTIRNRQLDDFVIALADMDNNPNNIRNTYLMVNNILGFDGMIFNRSTLSQLKSGGNMHFIRNKQVVDSIYLIDNIIGRLEVQLETYAKLVIKNSEYIGKIFDNRIYIKYQPVQSKLSFHDFINEQSNLKYLCDDEKLRVEFSMIIAYQKSVFDNYIFALQEYQKLSKRVVLFIKREYHLNG